MLFWLQGYNLWGFSSLLLSWPEPFPPPCVTFEGGTADSSGRKSHWGLCVPARPGQRCPLEPHAQMN